MIKNRIGSIPKSKKEKLARLKYELKNKSQQVATDEKKKMRQLSKGK